MKSPIVKRAISIVGHKTAISLEDPFWELLKKIAQREQTLSDLLAKIDQDREHANLSSAIRVFVLGYVREQAEAAAGAKWPDSRGH
jgi:predicted DNA-binding ribbon-helix-helix protein